MKTSLFPILSLLVVTLWLSGCSTSPSRMKSHLGMTVTPPPEDALPDALLEYEKRNWGYREEPSGWLERKTWQQFVENQRTYVQQVFTASRKPYVLGFARQQAANRPDWRQLRKTTLDLTNVGMHLFGGGATLAPLWTLALDVDTFALTRSLEGKMMRMPSLTLYVPYPDLASLPVDEAMVAATNDLGERLVRTGLCRYLTAPHQGTYGSFVPGQAHYRTLMCGEPSTELLSAKHFGNASITTYPVQETNLLSRVFGPGTIVATLYWVPEWTNYGWEIQQKFHDFAWMGPQFTSAIDGFRTLKPVIPERAYAVITGPDGEGEWKVFVARDDVMVAYEPSWTRAFKRARLQAEQAREDLGL